MATYGRSLVALACGLLGARWVLAALGEVDYGLWGVIGGMSAFVSFLNGQMAQSVSRFLAVAVGAERNRTEENETVSDWFWTAVVVHLVLATSLVVLSWPVGEWAVRHWLTVPSERMEAAVWVWRFVCVNTWFGMVLVPWSALYVAKQEIAEQTVYGVVTNVVNTCFLAWMAWHPSDWLAKYALWTVFASQLPQLTMAVRVHFKWRDIGRGRLLAEEGFRRGFVRRTVEMARFAGWRMFGGLSGLFETQGMALAVNRLLGPVSNAAFAIGNSAGQQSMALGGALSTAMFPAIANAFGAGDRERMKSLAFSACRLGTLLVLAFAIPLSLEIGTVMRLWLGKVPADADTLCVCVLAVGVLEKLCDGHWMSILAAGRIRGYQVACVFCGLSAFAFAVIGLCLGWGGLRVVGVALVAGKAVAIAVRLGFGRTLVGLGVGEWVRRVLLPCLCVGLVAWALGLAPRLFGMKPGLVRVITTSVFTTLAFLPEALGFLSEWFNRRRFDVDLVYCWCNGEHFENLEKCRFHNNGELYYSLKSVDRFAPWFRTIWVFVNDGTEIPDWLQNHPKVKIVKHSEVIPERYLPLYNAVSIEFWLGDIPGLAEHFVYANDDMFLCRPVRPGLFFTVRGEPICRYEPYEMKDFSGSYGRQLENNRAFMRALGQEIADNEWCKAECHAPHHNMDGYRKSVLKEFCSKFPEEVEKAGLAKFRSFEQCQRDVFSLWAMATGRGVFRSQRRGLVKAVLHRLLPGIMPPRWESLLCSIESTFGYRMMAQQRPYMCCLNDNENVTDADRRRAAAWMEQAFGDGESRLDRRLM